ncbi:MAG: ankyrin repeat domain-containing protein, partial [Gemmatimonadaceae bacterium]
CRTDILMASALGDIDRVRAFLDADPASVETAVNERYFPKINPRAGGSIYIWTLGGNKSAHIIAREFGHDDVYRLLVSRTRDALKLAVACELGDRAAYDAIRASHPDIATSFTDADLRNLVTAAESNNETAVRMMLVAGWPPNAGAFGGATALHWAGFHGNAEMARVLLEHHADTDVVEAQFNGRPLGWALHGSLHGWHRDRGDYPATVEALLDAGATAPSAAEAKASEAVMAILHRRNLA